MRLDIVILFWVFYGFDLELDTTSVGALEWRIKVLADREWNHEERWAGEEDKSCCIVGGWFDIL